MKLAFYTYSYIDRLGMEPADVLPLVAAAGYDGIDLSATWHADEDPALFPRARRQEIRALADDLGLSIEALVTHLPLADSLRDGRPINLPGAIELAIDLGASVITAHIGSPPVPIDPATTQKAWSQAVAYLADCCKLAQGAGVFLATDAVFPNFLTPTPESVAKLIDEVNCPFMGHNFDPCYVAVCGFDLEEATQTLGTRIVHAHIKDHLGLYPNFLHHIPGEGELDHHRWVRALAQTGFQGSVTVECFPDMELSHALAVGYRTIAGALAAVGARPLPST